MKNLILIFFVIYIGPASLAQKKEVLLIGTMHTVPKIVKNSYKTLLKKVLDYKPEAIYVESPRAQDSISWQYLKDGWSKAYKEFYFLSDSLRHNFSFRKEKLNRLLKKSFKNLTASQLDTLIYSFGYLRDYANYKFYRYIKKHGSKGTKKPSRHEDGDLTAKLALQLNIKRLQSMDDQQTNKKYHLAWKKCAQEGKENGDNKINQKINKKQYNRGIIPALFGRLGWYVNKRKSLTRLHKLAAFTYVKNKTKSCTLGEKYWNKRNQRMAKNIGSQIKANRAKKNIVIVGAAHIIGLEKSLKKDFPEIKVTLLED